jgi:uncharacterized protein (DUF1810 family)
MDDPADAFDLARFVEAQAGGVYETALGELEAGRKQTHWMWFIMPEHRDLGRSSLAKHYGLSGVDEAAAYAAHPLLGPRLRACIAAVRRHLAAGRSAEDVLGSIDALKYASCLEIFAAAVPDEPLFGTMSVPQGSPSSSV